MWGFTAAVAGSHADQGDGAKDPDVARGRQAGMGGGKPPPKPPPKDPRARGFATPPHPGLPEVMCTAKSMVLLVV